jgi:trk system potassium uptake protein
MHVIIGGCGRVGAELADRLSDEGHDVVVVDLRESAFNRIGGAFNGETVTGDITDKDALIRAGIERAAALIACTDLDNANLMAVQIASELFGVPRTVARLFNPEREDSYRKMGVHYVSGTRLVAKALANEIRAGVFPLHVAFTDGDVEVVEMKVTRDGHGVTVAELESVGNVRVAAVQRGLRVRIPRLDDRLQQHDLVVAAIRRGAHKRLGTYVGNPIPRPAPAPGPGTGPAAGPGSGPGPGPAGSPARRSSPIPVRRER